MILVQRTQRVCVYEYEFEMHVTHCKVQVRFPCTFFLSWKTGNQTVEDNHQVKAVEDTIPFNSRLTLKLEVAYDQTAHVFLQKKTLLCVNLRPSSNPNEVRLVGTVPIDLANYLNSVNTHDLRKYYMDRCPDKEGFLMLSIKEKYGRQIKASEMLQLPQQPSRQPVTHQTTVPILNLTGSKTPEPQRQRSSSKEAILARIANLRKPLQTARARIQQTQPDKTETEHRTIVSQNVIAQHPQDTKEIVNNSSIEQPQLIVKLSDNQSEEVHNLKTICSDLNSKLTSQHSFRVKLQVELEKIRLENLQIKHIQKNLRKELECLKMVDHESALKTLRSGLQRLQQELKQKSNRIEYLEGQIQAYRNMKSRKQSMEEVEVQTDGQIEVLSGTEMHNGIITSIEMPSSNEGLELMPSNQHFLDQLSENKKKLQQLSVLHDTIQEDMINLTAQNQKLKEIQKLKEQEIQSLKAQLQNHHESLKPLDDLHRQLAQAQNQLKESRQENQHLRVQLRQSQCHIMQMSPDPRIYENIVTRMHRSYSNMSISSFEIAALKTMIEQKQLIIKYLEQQRSRQKERIVKSEEAAGRLQSILIETTRKADNLQRQLTECRNALMGKQIREITGRLVYNYNISQKDIIEIGIQTEDEVSLPVTLTTPSIQNEINKFKEQLHLSGQEDNELHDKIRQLERELKKQKAEVVDLTERNNLLERCVKKFEKQIGNHQKNIETQKAEIDKLRRESNGVKSLEEISKDVPKEEVSRKDSALREEISKLKQEITKLKDEATKREQDTKQLKQATRQPDDSLEKQLKIVQSKLIISQQQRASLQQQISSLKQQLVSFENQATSLQQQVQSLHRLISTKQQQIYALREECILKESIINDKGKQLEQLSQKFQDIVKINQQNILQIQHLTQEKQSYQVRLNLLNSMASPVRKVNDNGEPANMMLELDELQQIIIALSGRNRQLNQKIRSISHNRMTFQEYARELSLELNKAKVKILNMAFDVQNKKQCVLSLRPLQCKIDTILQFTKQLNAMQDKSWTSSGDETDPAEMPNQQ